MATLKPISAQTMIALAQLAIVGALGWAIYRSVSTWKAGAEGAGDWLGEKLAPLFVPNVVEAQIRLKSAYFDSQGFLTAAAREVISSGYPNMYATLFQGDRIKPQYASYIDSGQPLTDGMFKG